MICRGLGGDVVIRQEARTSGWMLWRWPSLESTSAWEEERLVDAGPDALQLLVPKPATETRLARAAVSCSFVCATLCDADDSKNVLNQGRILTRSQAVERVSGVVRCAKWIQHEKSASHVPIQACGSIHTVFQQQ